jgi:predicted ATPase/class 3 adenylate cyclase
VAERRQLTVMFCDLVGSTALSTRLDPEELHQVLRTYRDAIAAAVHRYDGHVAQYLGDGVLAYFGWPRSHEHEAERAVRAGFAAIEAVRALPPLHRVAISVRIGIATGLVVVGEMESHDDTAVGETPNLAARLQGAAAPDSIVIEPATRRLLGDLFELEELPPLAAKGFAQPVAACKVLRPSRIESRFEAFHASALTPMVGRDEEVELLLRRWERAKGGAGQLVVLSGEGGIGKSRLVAALRQAIQAERHEELRYFCSPHHRDSSLYPIASQIERAAAFDRDAEPAVQLDRLDHLVDDGPHALLDRRLFAELLRLPALDRYPQSPMTPQQRKQRTFEALMRRLEALAARAPLLQVFEDVHWIDPTSQDALDRFVERVRTLPALLIVTCRPEYVPAWVGQPHVTMVNLARLDRRDGVALIRQVVGANQLSLDVVMGIAERTDGVPLFVEELTKAILEAGAQGGDTARELNLAPVNTVPAVLYASLMARLDRLGGAKEIAQTAAAIGRECTHELLAAVASLEEAPLMDALEKLTSSGLLIARGTPPDATYLFKHALVQDAAYGTLLISRRQQLHGRIAELMVARFPDMAAREPELVARHFAEARQAARAVPYWIAAGRHAAERSANLEAIRHLSLALEAIQGMPEGEERDRQELVAQTAIGTPLISVHGYAATETGAAYTRARLLSQRLGDKRGIYATLGGEFSYFFVRADQAQMRHLTQEAKSIADTLADDSLRQVERRLAGLSGMHFGDFTGARAALEAIVDSYDASRHRPPPVHYVHDPKIYALAYLAVIVWIQGFPDQARRWSAATMAYAAELNNANMTAFAHIYGGAGLHELLRDVPAVRAHAATITELAEQHSLHYFRLSGVALNGWLLAMEGNAAQGIALMQSSIEERAALAVGWYQARYLCMLAEVCLQHGDVRAGADFIARAQAHGIAHDEHLWEAELHRVEGELKAREGRPDEVVEACFQRALDTARAQGARSFELRAATSLARHWLQRGRAAQARALLAPVHAWFTEGHDTADLQDAARLLEDLRVG